MKDEVLLLRDTHEERDDEDELVRWGSFTDFERIERNGYGVLEVKRAGREVKQLSAIDKGLRIGVIAEDMDTDSARVLRERG